MVGYSGICRLMRIDVSDSEFWGMFHYLDVWEKSRNSEYGVGNKFIGPGGHYYNAILLPSSSLKIWDPRGSSAILY